MAGEHESAWLSVCSLLFCSTQLRIRLFATEGIDGLKEQQALAEWSRVESAEKERNLEDWRRDLQDSFRAELQLKSVT